MSVGLVGVVSTLLGPEGTRGLVLLQTTGLDSEFKPVIRVGGQVSQWWIGFLVVL
jgi:hypothetical protein